MKKLLISVFAMCLLVAMLVGCADEIIVDSGLVDSDSYTDPVSDSMNGETNDVTDEDTKKDEDTQGEVKEKVLFLVQ